MQGVWKLFKITQKNRLIMWESKIKIKLLKIRTQSHIECFSKEQSRLLLGSLTTGLDTG